MNEKTVHSTPTLDISTLLVPAQGLLEQAVYFQLKVIAASSDCWKGNCVGAIVSRRSWAELKGVNFQSPTHNTSATLNPAQGSLEQAVYLHLKVLAASSDCWKGNCVGAIVSRKSSAELKGVNFQSPTLDTSATYYPPKAYSSGLFISNWKF